MTILARPTTLTWDHMTTVGLPYSLSRIPPVFPPTTAEPFDPTTIFGRLMPSPCRPDTNLGSTITNPLRTYYGGKLRVEYLVKVTNMSKRQVAILRRTRKKAPSVFSLIPYVALTGLKRIENVVPAGELSMSMVAPCRWATR